MVQSLIAMSCNKTVSYKLSVPSFVHFSFSPMKISVADLSAPIGTSVFKFCVRFQVGKVYCVNENKDANAHFVSYFKFFFCHSYIMHIDIFVRVFLAATLGL